MLRCRGEERRKQTLNDTSSQSGPDTTKGIIRDIHPQFLEREEHVKAS